jgi:hypothetical protein
MPITFGRPSCAPEATTGIPSQLRRQLQQIPHEQYPVTRIMRTAGRV